MGFLNNFFNLKGEKVKPEKNKNVSLSSGYAILKDENGKNIFVPTQPNPDLPYYVKITETGANLRVFKGKNQKEHYFNSDYWKFIEETNFHSNYLKKDKFKKEIFIAKANAYAEFSLNPKIKFYYIRTEKENHGL